MTQNSIIGLEWIPTQYRSETLLAIVRSVEVANHAGADCWGLRLDEDSLMLKVGPHEVLQVVKRERSKSGMPWHLIVDRELIPARLRSRDGHSLRFSKDTNCYGERRVSSYYPSNPGTEACDFEFSVLKETYHALHDAHVAVIRRAVGLRLNPATRQKHSSALVSLLASETGHSVAQPAWMTIHEKQERM
jgi:hypothetical protein